MKRKMVLLFVIAVFSALTIQNATFAGELGPLLDAYEKSAAQRSVCTMQTAVEINAVFDGTPIKLNLNLTLANDADKLVLDVQASQIPEFNIRLISSGKKLYALFKSRKEYLVKDLSDESYAKLQSFLYLPSKAKSQLEYVGTSAEKYGDSMLNYEDYQLLLPLSKEQSRIRHYFNENKQLQFTVLNAENYSANFEILNIQDNVDAALYEIPGDYILVSDIPQELKEMKNKFKK